MKQYQPLTGIGTLCRLFGKTRQAFYDHNWHTADEQLYEGLIIEQVRLIRTRVEGIGGSQLHGMLKEVFAMHDIMPGRDRFYTLLRKYDLLIKRRKRYVITTNSNHPYYKWADLRINLEVTHTAQLWVSDITYLRTGNGFVYLSLITDAYSRKILGYHVSQRLKAQGCIIALNKAIGTLTEEQKKGALIHHSDRGVQYCCDAYVNVLQNNKINISMTQSGSPYDNAIAERVNGILKHQVGLGKTFKSYPEAVASVCTSIDAYNCIRPHMSLGNLTPEQAHTTNQKLNKKWKPKKYPVKSG